MSDYVKAKISELSAGTMREVADVMARHSWAALASASTSSPLELKTKYYHCVHPYLGALHMVVPDGHVVVQCCECDGLYTHHSGHRWEGTDSPCSRRRVVRP